MKRYPSWLTLSLFAVLIGFYLQTCSASFVFQTLENGDIDQLIFQEEAPQTNVTSLPQPVSDSNENFYETAALTNFLIQYNYSNGWYDSGFEDPEASDESTEFIFNECWSTVVSNNPIAIACELDLYNLSLTSTSVQSLQFYINETSNYSVDNQNSLTLSRGLSFSNVPVNIVIQNEFDDISDQSIYDSQRKFSLLDCFANVTFEFTNLETNEPFDYVYDSVSELSIQVSVTGGTCNLTIATPLLVSDVYGGRTFSQTSSYLVFMIIMGLVQIFSCMKLARKISHSDSLARRVSVGTLSSLIIFDFYIYLVHFRYWTMMLNSMVIVVILFFMISVLIEPILLYYVFRGVRRTNDQASILTLFYKLYFWLLISAVALILSLTYLPNCVFYTYPFFILPQIIDNVSLGLKYKWNHWFLLGLGLPKFFYIVYTSFDPLGLNESTFDFKMILFCMFVLGIEGLILKVQTKRPTLLFRSKYTHNYYDLGDTKEAEEAMNDACSICMEKLSSKPLVGLNQSLLTQAGDIQQILKTPCKHYYHNDCLHEWVKKKLECPNCRQTIPPLDDTE